MTMVWYGVMDECRWLGTIWQYARAFVVGCTNSFNHTSYVIFYNKKTDTVIKFCKPQFKPKPIKLEGTAHFSPFIVFSSNLGYFEKNRENPFFLKSKNPKKNIYIYLENSKKNKKILEYKKRKLNFFFIIKI